MITFLACQKDSRHLALEEFCNLCPEGWTCEIITENFEINDIPKNCDHPVAIIKYKNVTREFAGFGDGRLNPSLILDVYPISQKKELVSFIRSQQLFSWCIPVYYGETGDYFIITSPCFINGGLFTDEAKSSIKDLHEALKTIITVKDYGLITD